MDKQELLNCAADYIEKNGKAEGRFFDAKVNGFYLNPKELLASECPACAMGAMIVCEPVAKSLYSGYEYTRALNRIKKALGYDTDEAIDNKVYQYSDTHTKEEVVAWLRNGMKENG